MPELVPKPEDEENLEKLANEIFNSRFGNQDPQIFKKFDWKAIKPHVLRCQ